MISLYTLQRLYTFPTGLNPKIDTKTIRRGCFHPLVADTPITHLHQLATCKARYAVLFQIWTFLPKPEDEAHIGPTATYEEVIHPGFQHDITTLQIQGYNISYNRHTAT